MQILWIRLVYSWNSNQASHNNLHFCKLQQDHINVAINLSINYQKHTAEAFSINLRRLSFVTPLLSFRSVSPSVHQERFKRFYLRHSSRRQKPFCPVEQILGRNYVGWLVNEIRLRRCTLCRRWNATVWGSADHTSGCALHLSLGQIHPQACIHTQCVGLICAGLKWARLPNVSIMLVQYISNQLVHYIESTLEVYVSQQ